MRQETVIKTMYTLDELSETAQERAYYRWQDGNYSSSDLDVKGSIDDFTSRFPICVDDWEISDCSRSYVKFHISGLDYNYSDEIMEMSNQRLATWLINNYDHVLTTGQLFWTKGYKKSRRSKIIKQRACIDDLGYAMMKPIQDFIANPTGENLHDIMESCFYELIKSCQAEMEHLNSFTTFQESCEANEIEFDEDGNFA